MHADSRLDAGRAMREWSKNRSSVGYERVIGLCCLLPTFLTGACGETDKVKYLTAAEIQESIVGNSLKEAESGDWKEEFIPFADNRREGMIRGHSPEGPYGGTWSITGDSMCLKYPDSPEQSGCYRFSRGNGLKILWFDQTDKLAFHSQLIEGSKAEAITVESVFPDFRKEIITFRHGENMLLGDLSLPAGPAPYPAVAFVHGSGPVSRHDWAVLPLRATPDEFLKRGFATLIWSKPGVDESTGDYLKQSMAQRADEVAAAMAYLAERADIDGNRIGLWGGSQAGWVMPMVPAHRNVAFVIAVSCPGQTGLKTTLYSVGNELASSGISEEDRVDALEHIRALLGMMQIDVDYEEFRRGQQEWLAKLKLRSWYPQVESKLDELVVLEFFFSTIDSGWFEFFSTALANDAPPQLENLHMPLLAIYGTNDSRVDPNLGAEMYEEVPRAAGNPDVTVKLFEGADHGIMTRDSEGYLEHAPGYLTTMGDWLAARH